MAPLLAVLMFGALLFAAPSEAEIPEPVRLATNAFGASAEIEVRDLPAAAARAAIEAALSEIYAISVLTDPEGTDPGGVGSLNQSAGHEAHPVDPRVGELLLRSLQFCIWSGGAYGPLGGGLYQMWGELETLGQRPAPSDLRRYVGSAECSRLVLGERPPGVAVPATAQLAEGSRVDLRGIVRGFAVDRAVSVLEQHGARNFWAEVGPVLRAGGGGPDGRGWLTVLPPPPGGDEPLDQIWLRDQALAIFSVHPSESGSEEPLVDQRSGVEARGVVTVVAVTELAADAEPLVSSLFVLGHRDGHMKLGILKPRPSVYWLLGQGSGTPLEASYRWSELERVRRR